MAMDNHAGPSTYYKHPVTSTSGAPSAKATTATDVDDGKYPEPFTRPPYAPVTPTDSPILARLQGLGTESGPRWKATVSHDVHFTRASFFSALKNVALHPERNSSLILRADPLPPRNRNADRKVPVSGDWPDDRPDQSSHADDGPDLDEEASSLGLERREEFRVRLMPRQVKRDGRVNQRIPLYQSKSDDMGVELGMVMMVPEVESVDDIPFYHPPVRKLAFIYETVDAPASRSTGSDDTGLNDEKVPEGDGEGEPLPPIRGRISIAYLPFSTHLPGSAGSGIQDEQSHTHSQHLSGLSGKLGSVDGNVAPRNPILDPLRRTPPKRRSPLSQSLSTPEGDDTPRRPAVVLEPGISAPNPSRVSDPGLSTSFANGVNESKIGRKVATRDGMAPEIQLRTERTLKLLLETVYKYGYSDMIPYQKRVHHDVVVQREPFQDLYLVLKDRHRHLESRAPKPGSNKVEDVKRHVWKDVAIAAFLMLLWKEMYPPNNAASGGNEWDAWGRPPGGFVDLGCGNGLLVHILRSEGYQGKGYELRSRRTWPMYPPETREALVELSIDFPSWFPEDIDQWELGDWEAREACPIRTGSFIIGNHADEITPWIPLLSLLPQEPVPHISLPCCFHTLDGPYTHLSFDPPPHPHSPPDGFDQGLQVGQSRYKSYVKWLGWQGLMCGWEWEKESLRIPSTKGWAIVARNRWAKTPEDVRQCRIWALEQVNQVRQRGLFKIREKEGKDH